MGSLNSGSVSNKEAEKVGAEEEENDNVIEASFGENVLEIEGRERWVGISLLVTIFSGFCERSLTLITCFFSQNLVADKILVVSFCSFPLFLFLPFPLCGLS